MENRILNVKEVCRRFGIARSTVYAQVAQGKFPPPRRITENRVGWPSADLDKFLSELPLAASPNTTKGVQ